MLLLFLVSWIKRTYWQTFQPICGIESDRRNSWSLGPWCCVRELSQLHCALISHSQSKGDVELIKMSKIVEKNSILNSLCLYYQKKDWN